MSMQTGEAETTRTIALADPGPLGLACFALTTFVLSVFNAGLVDKEAQPVVFGLALFYGGAVQVLAGLLEFFKKNVFGAVAFCSYGAFWMAFWYLSSHPEFFPADSAHRVTGVGVFLLAWTIFTGYMWVVALRINGVLAATFTLLLITFILLTIADLTGNHMLTTVAGFCGLITAFLAWYGSFAGVLNQTSGKALVPTWPRP
ncbi:MAG: acetate uptake transporter [Propionicimonas sp.]